MRLSAPIFQLKRKARSLARAEGISLHEALDRVAADEGFARWSLLAVNASAETRAAKLYRNLAPGDLLLVGARPRQGKTLFSLELLVEAMRSGRRGVFFSLEYTRKEMLDRFAAIGVSPDTFANLFEFDNSDEISADYIISRLTAVPQGALIVVDYLQILDQKRHHPDLSVQIRRLRAFAQEKGVVFVFISQIDRAYDPSIKPCPDLGDVRLPNPIDLTLFAKTCFLSNGDVRFGTPS